MNSLYWNRYVQHAKFPFYINEKDGALYPELTDFYSEKYFDMKSELMSDVIKIVGTADENGEFRPYSIAYVTRESVDKMLTELGHIEDYSGRPEIEGYYGDYGCYEDGG